MRNRKYKVVHSTSKGSKVGCAGGTCPTIYETEEGTLLIQGKKLDEEQKNRLNIPNDEDVIEVPKEFIETFLTKE